MIVSRCFRGRFGRVYSDFAWSLRDVGSLDINRHHPAHHSFTKLMSTQYLGLLLIGFGGGLTCWLALDMALETVSVVVVLARVAFGRIVEEHAA
jgi:hypothetical protein